MCESAVRAATHIRHFCLSLLLHFLRIPRRGHLSYQDRHLPKYHFRNSNKLSIRMTYWQNCEIWEYMFERLLKSILGTQYVPERRRWRIFNCCSQRQGHRKKRMLEQPPFISSLSNIWRVPACVVACGGPNFDRSILACQRKQKKLICRIGDTGRKCLCPKHFPCSCCLVWHLFLAVVPKTTVSTANLGLVLLPENTFG